VRARRCRRERGRNIEVLGGEPVERREIDLPSLREQGIGEPADKRGAIDHGVWKPCFATRDDLFELPLEHFTVEIHVTFREPSEQQVTEHPKTMPRFRGAGGGDTIL